MFDTRRAGTGKVRSRETPKELILAFGSHELVNCVDYPLLRGYITYLPNWTVYHTSLRPPLPARFTCGS